jgi:hypothetical protein
VTCAVRQPGTCYRRRFSVGNRRRSPVEACGGDGVESTGVRRDPASGAAVVKQNDKQNDAALLTVSNGILEGKPAPCRSRLSIRGQVRVVLSGDISGTPFSRA